MKKYFFRVLIAVFVFLFFKITKAASVDDMLHWHIASSYYMIYTIVVVILLWEILYRAIKYFDKLDTSKRVEFNVSSIFIKTALVSIPFVLLFSFIFNFYVIRWIPNSYTEESHNFFGDAATGYVMGLLIIYYELVKISTRRAIKNAKEKESIQKELFAAKYEGLKNQVNPHFLFNSFSTLTSLVETDPKAAVQFIDKLSDLYRYVLEHDRTNMVTLEDELDFMNDYLFLLDMRHQGGIHVLNEIDLPIKEYKVPSLSIQTLIENAVKHNSFSDDEPLEILIKNDKEDFVTVSNLKRPKKIPQQSTKIGLKNLANRIRLSLKKELEISEDESTFMVKLPLA